MPPASSGIKCLVPTVFLGGHHVRRLAYSATSASHLLQGAQQQLILKKHSCSISEAQQSQSPGQSLGSLAQTQSAHAWRHAQASHNQQRHQLLADAAAPASYPAPSAQSLHTAFSGTASQQQHPAYQQQLSRNEGPQQGHQRPLLLQPSLPPQQQLVHHHLLRHHTQRAQCHSWPHQRQQVHYYHFHSHHRLSYIHHHCLLHQQLQQQQLRRSMATRSIPFVDQVRMVVEGGKGGNGCVSFAQVARGRRQAASGGNGGDGGSVVLRASRGARELRGLPRVVRGGPGGHGRPNGRTGAHGETRIVDVPVGMVVSLLEDAPLEASELLSSTTTTMQSGTTMEFSTARDQSNWAPRAVHKDNQTSSTTSLRKRLYHDQDYSDTNIDSSVQRASLQGSPAERDDVSRTDADSFSLLRRDFQAASQADVDSSFSPRHDSQAARGGWPAEEQGAKVPRHNRQSDKSDEPHDKVTIEKGIEKAREGTRELGGPEAAHSQQQGVVAGGGPMWEHRGEEDSEAEECEDDEDDVEVEEDEEEEGEEEFEEGMGWEGGGDDEVGEAEQKPPQRLRVLAELLELGQQITVAVGGHGGSGNASTPSPSRSRFRPPSAREPSSEFTQGSMGSSATLVLELKMLADVGLVGMPNAGKSSLLKALTGARAKVGSYAFTTLHPQLGTIVGGSHEPPLEGSSSSNSQSDKGSSSDARSRQRAAADGGAHEGSYQSSGRQSLVLADIPGLISGAHEDRGRGNLFLRHVERVGCIAYVVDLSGGQREANSLVALTPAEQLAVLQEELQAYRACRQEVPLFAFHGVSASNESQAEAALHEQGPGESPVQAFELVIANKVDACVRPQQALAELKESTHLPIIPVSALHAAGLERLASTLQAAVQSARSRC